MKIVIHIGMHKTGSSSIQHTFVRLSHPDLFYIEWSPSGNHSALFVLLFEDIDRLGDYHAFKARGPEFIRTLPALREEWHTRVSEQLSRATATTVIFSAEDISAPTLQNALPRLHDFFARWSDDISVIGYVRSPSDFMASVFQQYLQGGTIAAIHRGELSPHYRARFEPIDRIFGRQRVRLKGFSQDRLLGGDVVLDFAHEIGISSLSDDQVVRTNESLSLEAVALLYVQRKLGQGFVAGFDGANEANTAFISGLATIGRRKLAFSSQMLAPILERERDGIEWMEDRLGHGLTAQGAVNGDAISSLDDLVDMALDQFDSVNELLVDRFVADVPVTIEVLVQLLERLREQYYEEAVGGVSRSVPKNDQHGSKGIKEISNMENIAEKTERPQPTDEQLRLRRVLATILWHVDHKDDMPSDPSERKAAFDLVKQDYIKKAIDLTWRLENNKVKLVHIGNQARPGTPTVRKTRP